MATNNALAVVNEEEVKKAILAPVTKHATEIVIKTPQDRLNAMVFIKEIKTAAAKVHAICDPVCEAANIAHKAATAQRALLLAPLDEGERMVKGKVNTFDAEAERVRQETQRKLQAEADEKARKEREKLEKEAAKLKTPELREARLEQAALVSAPVVEVASVVEKVAGESTRKLWRAQLVSMHELVAAAAAGNPLAMNFLDFNAVVANKQATASKDAIQVPGVKFFETSSLAVRG